MWREGGGEFGVCVCSQLSLSLPRCAQLRYLFDSSVEKPEAELVKTLKHLFGYATGGGFGDVVPATARCVNMF